MKLRKKQAPTVEISHYAPDVTFTAVDYQLPDMEQRLKDAEERISDFLLQTAPDRLCEGFFDAEARGETELLLAMLRAQAADHTATHRSIANKHHAELLRLQSEMRCSEQMLLQIEAELSAAEHTYAAVNGGVEDAR